ncbi:MAG: polysaccharide deacetylase family protein [Chitinophagaceae bacterium]|nr:MAG: polysaccharide deacetylase family protein [Chitinophagaceae bacterium]
MLTFKNTTLFFGLMLIALIAVDIYFHVSWVVYFTMILLYSLLLFYGSAYVASGFYMKVISRGATGLNQIAISFDDGPADQFTGKILDLLAEQDVPAAFFCIGKNIEGREEIIRRLVSSGHIIGNHSYGHHFWFDMYGATKMTADLQQMSKAVQDVTGLRPRLFRPPYGVTNPNLAKAVRDTDLVAVGWNIRSMDTVIKDPEKLLVKVRKAVKPGAIILFHDTSEATFLMLKAFIEGVREQGYELVRLDKLINTAPYE